MSYKPASKRPTKRIVLPSDEECWVDIYTTKNWGDRKALSAAGTLSQEGDSVLVLAADISFKRFVADWNLTDDNGNKLPVDQTSFDLLADEDIDKLMDEIAPVINPSVEKQEAVAEEKKDSSKTPSVQSTQTETPPAT